jgi:hypothetical protein
MKMKSSFPNKSKVKVETYNLRGVPEVFINRKKIELGTTGSNWMAR